MLVGVWGGGGGGGLVILADLHCKFNTITKHILEWLSQVNAYFHILHRAFQPTVYIVHLCALNQVQKCILSILSIINYYTIYAGCYKSSNFTYTFVLL